MTPLVPAFRERFPRATLSVVQGLSSHLLEWLALGQVDCPVVYNNTTTPAICLVPVHDEPLHLVGPRKTAKAGKPHRLIGPRITLAAATGQPLVIASRRHSVRMLLEAALAKEGLRARVTLEIESVPAMLDLLRSSGLCAALALNAVRSCGKETLSEARAIVDPRLATTLWIANSAQRPRESPINQPATLLKELVLRERD